ncbi:MAG TPA: cupin domain-containing protein [Pseudonocardiaceae bacterium]
MSATFNVGNAAHAAFPALAELIAPVGTEEFFADYYEKRHLIARRGDDARTRLPLTLADLDQILSASSLRSTDLRVVADGQETPIAELAAAGDVNALELLYDRYRNGATIVFKFLNERWAPLRSLCQRLATEFSARIQVNVYLTPPGSRGLVPHFDTHDVLVLQVSGTKDWRLYDSPYPLPVHGQSYAEFRPADGPGAPTETFTLAPGDVLYMPRGCVHDASSAEVASLHLTIGILPVLWTSVIADAVQQRSREDERFRRALTPGFVDDAELRAELADALTDLFGALARESRPVELIDRAAQTAENSRQPELLGHLLDLESLGTVDHTTPLRRRDRVEYKLRAEGDRVHVDFHGKQITLPAYAGEELRFVLETPGPFSVEDIPGKLTVAGRSVLVKTLVREGLLTIG